MDCRLKIGTYCFLLLVFFNSLQGAITWSSPITISSSSVNASDPQLVIDSQANTTAAWVENGIIKSSSLLNGGSWSTPVSLSTSANIASSPLLGIDSSGNVTAVWIENNTINTALLPYGGSWSSENSISSSGTTSPALSVDASGNAVAVWVRNNLIESSTRISGTWNTVTTLSSAISNYPQVAISANGCVIAVWQSIKSGIYSITSSTSTLGGAWNSPKNVFYINTTDLEYHTYPKVAIDNNGNAIVVWFGYNENEGTFQNVKVLSSSLGYQAVAWSLPSRLSKSGLRNPSDLFLKILFDSNGNAASLWTNSYDGQLFYIELVVQNSGSGWGGSFMPYAPSLYSLDGDISVNSKGDALVIYMYWDGSLINIFSQETDIAAPVYSYWSNTNLVSAGSYNGYPKSAYASNGNTSNAAAVWTYFNGSNTVIQAAIGSETDILAPSNLNITQNSTYFGIYTDYFNTLTWDASISPNIQRYNIFRNEIFFESTDSNTLQITDHNAVQNGSVTYGVASMDIYFRQSSIATVSFP